MTEKTNSSNIVYISLVAIVAIVAMTILLVGNHGPAANPLARETVYTTAPAAADDSNLGGQAFLSSRSNVAKKVGGPAYTLVGDVFVLVDSNGCESHYEDPSGVNPMDGGYVSFYLNGTFHVEYDSVSSEPNMLTERFCDSNGRADTQMVYCNYGLTYGYHDSDPNKLWRCNGQTPY